VLFQIPQSYHATAGEYIAISDLERSPDSQAVQTAAQAAGAHEVIARLPRAYDTLLGRWFADGVELSGGEWLRVALARAFLRRSPIVILDEPTSFMDSWAENEWLERFRTLVEGRTTLIISHRFTTAMRADIIHVVDHGCVVESGSHLELMALGGLYAASWHAQMRASLAPERSPSSATLEHGNEVMREYSSIT
jgi:ATP-binding cassette subfamily B protein